MMANTVYYVIKVMVWDGEENKEMYFDLETGSLLNNWMEACTQDYTQQGLLAVEGADMLLGDAEEAAGCHVQNGGLFHGLRKHQRGASIIGKA